MDVYQWLSLSPLIVVASFFMFYRVRNRSIEDQKEPKEEMIRLGEFKFQDVVNFGFVVFLPLLSYFGLLVGFYDRVNHAIMATLQLYMTITHLSWSIGSGEPSYLHFTYVEGKTIGKPIMTFAIFADYMSFHVLINYCNYYNYNLEGWLYVLIYWNLFSHISELTLILLAPKTFYLWVFAPGDERLPWVVAFFKWLEGYIDSLGHLIGYFVVIQMSAPCDYFILDSTIIFYLVVLLFLGTFETWTPETRPANLKLLPPGLDLLVENVKIFILEQAEHFDEQ